jgi:hypothetical protein
LAISVLCIAYQILRSFPGKSPEFANSFSVSEREQKWTMLATQPAMAEAQATTKTSDAIVSMCGMRRTMVKSASAPPIKQPTIRRTLLSNVAPVLSSAMNVQVISASSTAVVTTALGGRTILKGIF